MAANSRASGNQPDMGKPQFASHAWLEPVIVVSIMVGSLIINRRRGFRIIDRKRGADGEAGRGRSAERSLLDNVHDNHSPDFSPDIYLDGDANDNNEWLLDDSRDGNDRHTPKSRSCFFFFPIQTPNSSRFANHLHSRVLAKFPFLVEMFYWILNFATYAATKAITQRFFAREGHGVLDLSQKHGEFLLWTEHDSWLGPFFFPIHEADFQAWFLNGHQDLITFLNRIYSLVHIPGTVSFISWLYYAAPSHAVFATARRTMTMGNFAAFFIFTLWPCMPPRLLPKTDRYHFRDTVRQSNAESVWVGGSYVNQLAAMPSLHFTYAFVMGCTFLYYSGIGRRVSRAEGKKSILVQIFFALAGIFYPLLVLTVIVATANHYWLDAVVAIFTVTLSLLCNRAWFVLLPLEDLLLWVLRLEKPVPTTGEATLRKQRRAGRQWRTKEVEISTDV